MTTTAPLRPFFGFYGGKWRDSPRIPLGDIIAAKMRYNRTRALRHVVTWPELP